MKTFVFLLTLLTIVLSTSCDRAEKATPAEGYIEVKGGKVWYRIDGESENIPLLLLHGGPGSSSYGLEPMKQLSDHRRIIFYDQLGAGRSDRFQDTSLMTVERYVDEVEQVRKFLGLDKFYLYGQSWGTALALEYYLKFPQHVEGIVFSSPYFSTEVWIRDADTLVMTLHDSVQQIIRIHEESKTFSNPEYLAAVDLFYSKFLRRKERSDAQKDTASMYFGMEVYEHMWGPSEFTATGKLLHYDRIKELQKITVPVLFLTGEYDEARPSTVRSFQSLIPGAKFHVIPNSGHVTLNDNPSETLPIIDRFLRNIDKK